MKRILFLGASPFTLGAIEKARGRGLEVLTTDNVPQNPGHRLADRSFAVDALDVDAVEALARSESVDALIGYASEVCALSAAVVAERLGLPGPGADAASRLSRKDQFRAWTTESGMQNIAHAVFEKRDGSAASRWAGQSGKPVVVKPVDNCGSRGVSVAEGSEEFAPAFERAAAASRCGRVLVEERLERVGLQICGDGFVENGKLIFASFGENRCVPGSRGTAIILEQYPASHPEAELERVRERLESIVSASGFRRGPVNFDAVVQPGGEPHVFEVGIRSGGNLIPDALSLTSGVDLVGAAIDCAIDPQYRFPAAPCDPPASFPMTYVAHSRHSGFFRGLVIAEELRDSIVNKLSFRQPGDAVNAFHSASDTVAVLLLSFKSREAMLAAADRMEELCVVELEPNP